MIVVDPANCYVFEGPGYAEAVATAFITRLEQGTAPWQKPWIPDPTYIPDYNPFSSGKEPRPYHGLNAIYLGIMREANGWEDKRWCTFLQAKEAGATIRRGEHGTGISYFQFIEKDLGEKKNRSGDTIIGENGQPERNTRRVPIFKYYTVFNAAQVDGLPPLEAAPASIVRTFTPIEDAERIIKNSQAMIRHDQYDRAFYSPMSDSIHLPGRDAFPNAGNYYATALHELGHWTGHESRLNRPIMNFKGSPEYAQEELRAEIGSYMISQQIGIPFDPSNHASYVASWVKRLKEHPKEILDACHDAERIMTYLVYGPKEWQIEKAKSYVEKIPRPVEAGMER